MMSSFRQILLLASLSSALVSALIAEPAPESPPGVARPGAANAGGLKDKRINVTFGNINLAQAMDVIGEQLPELNIVVPPSIGDVPIGPLKLRNVNVEGLLRAILTVTDGRIRGDYDGDAYLSFSQVLDAPQQQSLCRVLSLRQYLAGKKGNEVDRAIDDLNEVVALARQNLERARNGSQVKAPEFSVHPATKLLIVVGSPEAVALVEEVVNAVSMGATNPGAPAFGVGGGFAPFGGQSESPFGGGANGFGQFPSPRSPANPSQPGGFPGTEPAKPSPEKR